MAEIKRETLRKQIEKDLKNQLKEKQIAGKHYADLIQDYLSMWDLKNEFMDDIRDNGIKVSGMHGPKSNTSIADFHKNNDRMLKTLDALGLKASPLEAVAEGYTKDDLI